MAIHSASPEQAAELLSSDQGYVYLDVRSIPEFSQGHPRSASNVPLLHAEPGSRQLVPNPDFLRVVQANFPPESRLLLGCLSGGRSMKAAEVLAEAGYQNLLNVRGGFGGARDHLGRITEAGWEALGLPVERETSPGRSYQTLLQRANA
jgi:rhodanese-related sulfurtransferase